MPGSVCVTVVNWSVRVFARSLGICEIHCADHIGEVIEFENPETVAAVIVETITGSNARIVPPPEYYPRLREICDRYGVLLICDEVMAGFGRTGKWFAIEHYNVVPDLMTCGKGMWSSCGMAGR